MWSKNKNKWPVMNFEALSKEGVSIKRACVFELIDFIESGFQRELLSDGLAMFIMAVWGARKNDPSTMLRLINKSDSEIISDAQDLFYRYFHTLGDAITFIIIVSKPGTQPGDMFFDVQDYMYHYVTDNRVLERLKGET